MSDEVTQEEVKKAIKAVIDNMTIRNWSLASMDLTDDTAIQITIVGNEQE